MQRYIIQRFLLAIPTLIAITLLTFIGLRVILPQDAIDLIIGEYGRQDPEMRATLEKELGLEGSVIDQYLVWSGVSWFYGGQTGVLQGNLGESLRSGRPVMEDVKRRAPVSFELGLWAQFTAVAVSVPMGVFAALRQDKWPDYGLRSIGILLAALPGFWIAVLVITFGSLWFQWAPPLEFVFIQDDPIQHFRNLLVPALLLGLTPSGVFIRLARTQMLEVLRQDYVRTAHAKGLSNRAVVYRHAFRNALIPIVTVVGVSLPAVVSGTVIFEQIFTIPGMGRYLVEAINNLDYPIIQGLVLVYSILLLVSVILVDVSYAYLDPRIKYS